VTDFEVPGCNKKLPQSFIRFAVLAECLERSECHIARFQVLMAANMQTAVFWVVAPCSLAEVYRRFGDSITLTMEAASTPETSVNFCEATRRSNPEDSRLHICIVCTPHSSM
jgi:hypothetical protein